MGIEIKKGLSVLGLSGLARVIGMQGEDIKLVGLSYEKRLGLLLGTLIQEREDRPMDRLIRDACFEYPCASLEPLDYGLDLCQYFGQKKSKDYAVFLVPHPPFAVVSNNQ